jgi:hypothetical protein
VLMLSLGDLKGKHTSLSRGRNTSCTVHVLQPCNSAFNLLSIHGEALRSPSLPRAYILAACLEDSNQKLCVCGRSTQSCLTPEADDGHKVLLAESSHLRAMNFNKQEAQAQSKHPYSLEGV